jgi:RNA polymerase primary sigma factor
MMPYSDSRIMRRCGQLGIPYAEAIASRYFSEKGVVAPALLSQYDEGREGITSLGLRKRPIDSLKTLPHSLDALLSLLNASPYPVAAVRAEHSQVDTYASKNREELTIDRSAPSHFHLTPKVALGSGKSGLTPLPPDDGGLAMEIEDVDLQFVPVIEVDVATTAIPLELGAAGMVLPWTMGDGFGLAVDSWGAELTIAVVEGEGLSERQSEPSLDSDREHLVVGTRGRRSKRRAKPITGTRVSVDDEYSRSWCDAVERKGFYSSADVGRLIRHCTGNEQADELRVNVVRALEALGFGEASDSDVQPLWDEKICVDAEDVHEAIQCVLTRSTKLPGTQRFTMHRASDEARLSGLLKAKQEVVLALLVCPPALSAATSEGARPLGTHHGSVSSINRWIAAGSPMHGKSRRNAMEAVEALMLDIEDYRQIIASLTVQQASTDDAVRFTAAVGAYEEMLVRLTLVYAPVLRRMAARSTQHDEDTEDLFQAGFFGLLRALTLVNVHDATQFRSYAAIWINQVILKWRADYGSLIRIPLNLHLDLAKFQRALKTTVHDPNTPDGCSALAEQLNWKPAKLERVFLLPTKPSQLRALDQTVSRSSTPQQEQAYAVQEMTAAFDLVLGNLPERDAKVLRLYYGFDFPEEMTLEEIGSLLGVTRERIRQIRERALETLRLPSNRKTLGAFLQAGQ